MEGLHCAPLQLGPAQSGRPLRGARASERKVNMVSHAEKACPRWIPSLIDCRGTRWCAHPLRAPLALLRQLFLCAYLLCA